MNVKETQECLDLIFKAYPTQRQRMSADDMGGMLKVWCAALADIPFEQARAGVARIICSSKWMPSIADVRAEIGELHHGARRKGLDAWGDVLRAVSKFGYTREPVFEDPLVDHCVRSLGWQVICNSESSDPAPRARFVDLYNELAKDERKLAQISPEAKIPQRTIAGEARTLGDIVGKMLPSTTEE